MRRSYVQVNGVLYEKGTEPEGSNAPMVMPDIKPYTSMADGTMVTSRSAHREMLKRNNCQEVGNEALKAMSYYDKLPDVAPQQRKEIIRAQFDAMTHRQFKQAVKADVDRVKWNSRED
jgi:hypothetical protein